MAPQKKFPQKLSTETFDVNSSAGTFITLNLRPELLQHYGQSDVQIDHHISRLRNQLLAKKLGFAINERPQEPADMRTRNAWANNLANPNRASATPEDGSDSPALQSSSANKQARQATPAGVKAKKNASTSGTRRQPTATPAPQEKHVSFAFPDPDVLLNSTDTSREGSTEAEGDQDTDKENEMADKPKLKLRMSSIGGTPSVAPTDTPVSESTPLRTPAIKLSFKRDSIVGTPGPKTASPGPPSSSSKKRKIAIQEPQVQHAPPVPLSRKITFKTKDATPQTPVTPGLKLKTKGKVPRRPLGVGYDSELDEREVDPVILEGFILRMQPGSDCDYVRVAIENGTIGVHRIQGGAHVNMRFLDTQGRRGILIVRGNQYATTMVDLPCIIEGMKSWDKKGFIKSIDICQMLLVLGPCKTDDEARLYSLPEDVNPATYQYAHGITAPMKWVRKRRFEKFQKTRVDDIEAIDKRVRALLDDDAAALESSWQVLDNDPRKSQAREQNEEEAEYSEEEEDEDVEDEDEEEEEEEDEEDAEGEAEDYFGVQNDTNGIDDTTGFVETPQEEIDDDAANEFERMLAEGIDDGDGDMGDETMQDASLLMPDAIDSSFAVTSTSASPSAANADTPASGGATSDDDDEDDEEERDEEEKDDDENVQQTKDKIQDLEERIKEQTETLRRTTNNILRRKLATKIEELKGDVVMMKRQIGLVEEDEDED